MAAVNLSQITALYNLVRGFRETCAVPRPFQAFRPVGVPWPQPPPPPPPQVLMYHAFRAPLAPIRPFTKFLVVKSVVFLSFWQQMGVTALSQFGYIKQGNPADWGTYTVTDVTDGIQARIQPPLPAQLARAPTGGRRYHPNAYLTQHSLPAPLQNFILCFEMFVCAIGAAIAFPASEWQTVPNTQGGASLLPLRERLRQMVMIEDAWLEALYTVGLRQPPPAAPAKAARPAAAASEPGFWAKAKPEEGSGGGAQPGEQGGGSAAADHEERASRLGGVEWRRRERTPHKGGLACQPREPQCSEALARRRACFSPPPYALMR